MNIRDLLAKIFGWAKADHELEPRELTLDEVNSVVVSCFALGKGYYTNEASFQEKAGNKKGERTNVAKADLCGRLYITAREDIGKPRDATADEVRP